MANPLVWLGVVSHSCGRWRVARRALVAPVVFTLLAAAPAVLANGKYTVGDEVVVVADAKLKLGNSLVVDVWPGLVLRVAGVDGKWLWLNNGKPGWLDDRHVIPLNRAAIDRLTAMIRNNPTQANLYSGRADVWEHLGEVDIAIADLNEAIRLDPTAAYYINRGNSWHAKGDYDRAIADFDEALRHDPINVIAYNMRGVSWHAKGEDDRAIADYNEALRLDPKYAGAYNNRGTVWNDIKREHDRAIADYNEALRLDPKYALAYYNRGISWRAKGEHDLAIADYDRAIRINPKDSDAYFNRGLAWRAKGDNDRAIADYDQALRLAPKEVGPYVDRGNAWSAKGKYDRAISDYNAALRLDPKYAPAYRSRGFTLSIRGEHDLAIANFDEALRLDPKDVVSHYSRGNAWGAKGENDRAIADYDEALRIDPKNRYGAILGYLAAIRFGDKETAARLLAAAGNDPAWPGPAVRYLRGEIDETALLAAADNKDKQTEARCFLGLVHTAAGRRKEALAHFHWVRDRGNKDFIEFAMALTELRRLEAAGGGGQQ